MANQDDAYQAWLQDRAERALLAYGWDPERVEEEARTFLADFSNVADGRVVDAEAVLAAYEITGEMDAADLLALSLAPLRAIVPGIVVAGTTVIAAPPKIGKSVLCYQLAVEVALGGRFLGEQCARGAVLYLALEDGKRRGQDRLSAALAGRAMPKGRLTVRWDAPTIGHGLEEIIEVWLDKHGDAALVMIDTIQRVRPAGDGKRNAYEVDVQDLGRLQALTRDRSDLALLGVHHTKKDAGDDFVAAVSGTYGIAGSADTVILIKRKRHMELGVLEITGRELPETELPVAFRGLRWEKAEGVLPGISAERLAVYEILRGAGRPMMPSAVAKALGKDRSSVAYHVKALEADGLVKRVDGGYVVADPIVH